MATLPQQAPGPGPTAQALPSWLSYSAAETDTIAYTSTLTQVVYDPQGSFGPFQTVNVVQGTTTSVDYSVVNVPVLYTGPFPAPDLGTLYTTPGQSATQQASAGPQTATYTAGSGENSSLNNGATAGTGTQTAPPASAPTQTDPAEASTAPTDTATLMTEQSAGTAEPTQDGSLTAASAPTTSPTSTAPSQSNAPTSTTLSGTSPTTINGTGTSSATDPTSKTGTATNSDPSATAAGTPNTQILSSNSLSGGQIAGIVLGALFALLLLLLLLLCLRRRRKRRQEEAILGAATGGVGAAGGARGNYAAIGAGTAAPGRLTGDDWRDDHLTTAGAGSGFFVVGGRRKGDRQASSTSRRSRNREHYPTASITPSSPNRTGAFAGLAAAGAAAIGAVFGRKRPRNTGRVEIEEDPFSEDDAGDLTAERQGLMSFTSPDSTYGSGFEMREGKRRIFAPTPAVLVGGARGGSRPPSDAYSASGSGTSSSHTQRPAISSSNSGVTPSGSGRSLPPPPRASRSSPTSQTMRNVEPSRSSPPSARPGLASRGSAGTTDSNTSCGGMDAALLGVGGLGALAAGHRESDGSTYSHRNVRGSHMSEMSADELSHLRSTDPERYSRFISTGSTLLGPNYRSSPEDESSNDTSTPAHPVLGGTSAPHPTRLATIRSVGELGERSESGSPQQGSSGLYGSLGASSGSRRAVSPLPVYEPRGETPAADLPKYAMHSRPTSSRPSSAGEVFKTPMSEARSLFVTPPDSPEHTIPSNSPEARPASDGRQGAQLPETSAASAGVLGGVAAGWRRLTMGQFAWVPAASQDHQAPSSLGDVDEPDPRLSYDHAQRPSEDSSRLVHQRHGSRVETSETGMAPVVRSHNASVYGPSAVGHGSGSSGERGASRPSLSSRSRAGYSASQSAFSGRRTTSDMDSLSAAAQASSSRSTRTGGASERSISTGAASYNPSNDAPSSRAVAGDDSVATDNATRSGESASIMSDEVSHFASSRATNGSNSVEERKRPSEGLSRLDSLRERDESMDPFGSLEGDAGGSPTSGGWRPSPRVVSASQQAAEALVRPQQHPQGPRDDAPTAPYPQEASHHWDDLDTTFRGPDRAADLEAAPEGQTAGEGSDEEQRWNRSFEWPKFLQF